MKHRKAPIILISVLIIFGIMIALMNQPAPDPSKAQAGEAAVQGKPNEVASPAELAKTEQQPAGAPKPVPTSPMRGMEPQPRHMGDPGPGPIASNPPSKPVPKPKPTENGISTQWYPTEKGGK